MSTVIIIRGNSGSGKTTVANQLHQILGAGNLLISQDYVRRTMLKVHDRPNNLGIGLIESMISFGINNCEYTIIEGILAENKYGDMLRKALAQADRVHAYYYDLSIDETVKRHRTKAKVDFSEERLKDWFTPNDYLNIPGETIVTERVSEKEMVQLMLREARTE